MNLLGLKLDMNVTAMEVFTVGWGAFSLSLEKKELPGN